MKKKRLIILAVVVALTVAFVFIWKDQQRKREEEAAKDALKESSGSHVVDGTLYAHFSGVLYVFDDKTDQLLMESAVVMDGAQVGDTFDGELSVLDFPHGEDGFIEGTPLVTQDGEFYTVLDKKTCRHNEKDEDGNNHMVTHFTDYEFTYYVYPTDSDFLAVLIYEHLKDDYYVGILAQTEAQAKEDYRWFKANEP